MPEKSPTKPQASKVKTPAADRAERLQAALRDNLRRRKAAQAKPEVADDSAGAED